MTVAALSRMRVEMPLTHWNLTLYPLVDDNPKEADYLSLSDAKSLFVRQSAPFPPIET